MYVCIICICKCIRMFLNSTCLQNPRSIFNFLLLEVFELFSDNSLSSFLNSNTCIFSSCEYIYINKTS